MKKIRYFSVLFTLFLLTILSMFSTSPLVMISPSATPGPKVKATALSLEAQAGKSDGILFLGILIFIFIAVPLYLRYRELRSVN